MMDVSVMLHDNIILPWAMLLRAYLLFPSEKKIICMECLLQRSCSGFTAHFTASYAIKPLSDAIKYRATTQARRSVSRMAAVTFTIKQRRLLLSLLHHFILSRAEGRWWNAGFPALCPARGGGVDSLGYRTPGLTAPTALLLSSWYGWHLPCWGVWGRGGCELCCTLSSGDLPIFVLH